MYGVNTMYCLKKSLNDIWSCKKEYYILGMSVYRGSFTSLYPNLILGQIYYSMKKPSRHGAAKLIIVEVYFEFMTKDWSAALSMDIGGHTSVRITGCSHDSPSSGTPAHITHSNCDWEPPVAPRGDGKSRLITRPSFDMVIRYTLYVAWWR